MTMPLGILLASKLWTWLRHLGGPGLLVLGLADNSLIPMPGSMDVLTIWFAVHHHSQWIYYAAMATLGAVVGGYVTYRLARKGGKEMLEHRLGPRSAEAFYKRFERWGFWAVAVPALLPPPFPIVPFLLAAGAMQYSRQKFLLALTVGRGLRYGLLAYFGVLYGRHFHRAPRSRPAARNVGLSPRSTPAGISGASTALLPPPTETERLEREVAARQAPRRPKIPNVQTSYRKPLPSAVPADAPAS